jgi:tRNA pseudouridine38-40 synthase
MHDFKNFSEKSPEDKSIKCLIESLEITEEMVRLRSPQGKIYIRIKASHFLWKMVRRIVGMLVEAGRGNFQKEQIAGLLLPLTANEGEVINPAEFTAPPSGLFLEKVYY